MVAEFFATMPADNSAPIAFSRGVQFPQDGPRSSGSSITRLSSDAFAVTNSGLYRVTFQVPVNEAGQLVLVVNDVALGYTVVGRATGTTSIIGDSLVRLLTGDVLQVTNNSSLSDLTITTFAGRSEPISASLIFELIEADTPI